MGKLIQVPKELKLSFFFPDLQIHWEEEDEWKLQQPFHYEIAFYSAIECVRPWETPEKSIPLLLAEWKGLKAKLESLFASREKAAILNPMKKAIALLIEFLYWTNKTPVQFPLTTMQQLKIKPINSQERVEFILSRPSLYHSFVQLSELFNEQEKHYMKEQLLLNKKIRD